MRRLLALTICLCACGRVGFDRLDDAPPGDSVDARTDAALSSIDQRAYLKASNPRALASFGVGLALSADGSTLAVGAPSEPSAATGINGDQSNTAAMGAGAVYVFRKTGATWQQEAYIKASNTDATDSFGISVALSGDGSTLAVGAYLEASAATGVGGAQGDNSAPEAGAAYVFTRSGATWSQQAYIKASNTDVGDRFGDRVELSSDGLTLAVSAYQEASNATGINGDQADNTATNAGAVYVFTRQGGAWSQQAYLKASNTDAQVYFGYDLAFSDDGSLLAVGAEDENSGATGIDGDQSDNSAGRAGAAYVYSRTGTTWSQQAYVKASNTGAGDAFGVFVALSGDGATLAVCAYAEDSSATGIDGDQTDDTAANAGAVYVFTRSGTSWSQQAYVKASNTEAGDLFGTAVDLSADGDTLVVGAIREDGGVHGIGGDQTDNSITDAGAAYVFTRDAGAWSQRAYVKASNPDVDDELGLRVALSANGSTLAVSGYQESSDGTSEADNSLTYAGAVYIFE